MTMLVWNFVEIFPDAQIETGEMNTGSCEDLIENRVRETLRVCRSPEVVPIPCFELN